jgi:sugar O-acyltransferase (sialic acid O-acetyltransferase NeuD family)
VQLLIFPYNGNALEALDCLCDDFEFLGFVDDSVEKQGTDRWGYRVFGRHALHDFDHARVLAVPGSPRSYLSRVEIIEGLAIDVARFATVVHRTAVISKLAQIGKNVLIMAGVTVTSNAVIGSHVCVLPNTVIHHDVVIGDWSLIGSNVTVAGSVCVGRNCYIGSGSSIIHNVDLGDRAMVGLGSNVIRNVASNLRVAGNPARPLRSRDDNRCK